MRAWKRLKSLLRSDRGNVLMIGAAAMPLLMGSAGLAIDTIQLAFWKRQIQRAADSGALAGAHSKVQAGSTTQGVSNDLDENIEMDLVQNETPALSDAEVSEGSFANGVLSGASCAARGITTGCYNEAVQVTLTSERRLPFMSLFTNSVTTIEATATAAIIPSGRFCLVSLYDGPDPGITGSGNITLDLNCGIATNSRAKDAIVINGKSNDINATEVGAVGGVNSDYFDGDTVTLPYSSPVIDPFGEVPNPTAPETCHPAITVDGPFPVNAGDPTCYESITVKNGGTLTINTDKFYVKGLLDINNGGLVKSGTGVGTTLMLMGNASDLSTNGGGKLQLTAPTTGPYAGIAIFRDRLASTRTIKLTGGTDIILNGALYMPSTDLDLGGNGEMGNTCVQIVGRKLTFHGNPNLSNNCDADDEAAHIRMVRLVD
jgi:Flp pilus assembly protein TadG